MAADLLLAITHHLLVFALAGALGAQLLLVRPGLGRASLPLLGRLDAFYGLAALLVIAIGAARVAFGLRGWEYYVFYWAFWAKMAAVAAVGLLSVVPTARIAVWRRRAALQADALPPAEEIATVRRFLKAEAGIFLLIPIFAAIMARGIGA